LVSKKTSGDILGRCCIYYLRKKKKGKERDGEHVDLRFYNTMLAVDDLDEIRAALGFAKVNLWGGSWGTRAVFLYLRRHPQAVRTATMEGVAPPSLKNPLPHARSAQTPSTCCSTSATTKPACHAAFPNIRAEMHSVVQRLQQAPRRT